MKTALPFFLIGALLAAPAHAEKNADACKPDIAKFCKDVKPGGGAVHDCLKQHAAELSPACTQAREATKEKIDGFSQTCGGDIKTHCADVKPGGRRIAQCLKKNQDSLTPACKDELASQHKK